MKVWKRPTYAIVALFATIALSSTGVALAQADEDAKADKTGTNPVNFQRDIRFYN